MSRASSYRFEYTEKVYQYIDLIKDKLTEQKVKIKYFKGETFPEEYEVGSKMPTIWDLGRHLGFRATRLYEWEKKHPEFAEALRDYRELQKYFLIQNTLRGYYKENFAMFVMKNITDWSDTPKVKVDPKSLGDEEMIKYAKIALALIGGDREHKG